MLLSAQRRLLQTSQPLLTLLLICPCSLAEPQSLMPIANPCRPRRVLRSETRQTVVDLAGGHVKLCLVAEGQLAEDRLTELLARAWDVEPASLKVADGHARSVGIDEVSDLAAAVGEDGRLVFAVEQLAVAHEESRSDPVAEGLGLEVL